jgi:hypothetical protein
MTELKEILENAPLSALVKPGQKIALLEHNMTVGDALRVSPEQIHPFLI